jgi:hypothetical protein
MPEQQDAQLAEDFKQALLMPDSDSSGRKRRRKFPGA